jgi:hypothetical protein
MPEVGQGWLNRHLAGLDDHLGRFSEAGCVLWLLPGPGRVREPQPADRIGAMSALGPLSRCALMIHDHAVVVETFVVSDLTDEERYLLSRSLAEWGGPAHCTDALAAAMDFGSAAELLAEAQRLAPLIRAGRGLSRRDWRRALVSMEIVFASDVFGSGIDWSATVGRSDEETIRILRSLQRKIARSAKIHRP